MHVGNAYAQKSANVPIIPAKFSNAFGCLLFPKLCWHNLFIPKTVTVTASATSAHTWGATTVVLVVHFLSDIHTLLSTVL